MNCGYDYVKHRSNQQNSSLDVDFIDDDRNHLLAHNPNEFLDDKLAVREALELLRQDQRDALYWTDIEGYGIAEVAAAQGVAPGTIKSRRARARSVLRKAMA